MYTGGRTNFLFHLEMKHSVAHKATTREVCRTKRKQKTLLESRSPDHAKGIINQIVDFAA